MGQPHSSRFAKPASLLTHERRICVCSHAGSVGGRRRVCGDRCAGSRTLCGQSAVQRGATLGHASRRRRGVSDSRPRSGRRVGFAPLRFGIGARLSCRFPDRVPLCRTGFPPDEWGVGATPAWRANAASLRKRDTAAVSPITLAAVSAAQPRRVRSDDCIACTRAAIRRSRALIRMVRASRSASLVEGQLGD